MKSKKNMKFNFFLKTFIVGIVIVLFASCDKDISELGTNIVSDPHYGFDFNNSATVVAYNQSLGPVQTNNLPINLFGIYNSPVFGKTQASFVTQLSLAASNPVFYNTPDKIKIDSVYLYVPYYSTLIETNSETGNSTYKLDSIQGSGNIKLSVYESKKYFEPYVQDPNNPSGPANHTPVFYSDQQTQFENEGIIGGARLNDDDRDILDSTKINIHNQNDQFVFSPEQIKIYKNKDKTIDKRLAPGMLISLNKQFFMDKIVKAPSGKLFNNNVFQEYFRGLYFKVEAAAGNSSQGTLARMNFSKGTITMKYRDKTSSTDETVIRKTLTLNLTGTTVNLINNENNFPGYTPPDNLVGDSNLYLKGGDGSMAVIDLFGSKDLYGYDKLKNAQGQPIGEDGKPLTLDSNGNPVNGYFVYTKNNSANGVSDELDDLRHPKAEGLVINGYSDLYSDRKKWLVNEANLTFYINKDLLGSDALEPNRVYLYDLKNKRPLVDYYSDLSVSGSNKYNKNIHDGILRKGDGTVVDQENSERGSLYKVRLTNHIRNLITKDSTNVRLGLVVTENINVATNAYLKTPFTTSGLSGTYQTKLFPVMSVVNPLGTILYGTKSNVPADKKIKLEIYYTKPN